MLSIEERYDLFKNTLEECGSNILLERDDMIEYKLFEEFAVDAVSFLHENMLDALLNDGLIDDDIYEKCKKLRESYLSMQLDSSLRTASSVKESSEWKKFMQLSDDIRQRLCRVMSSAKVASSHPASNLHTFRP